MCMLLLGQKTRPFLRVLYRNICTFRLVNRTQNTLSVDHHFKFCFIERQWYHASLCLMSWWNHTCQMNCCPHCHWHQKESMVTEAEKTESKMGRDTYLFCCRCQSVICFKNATSANQSSHIPKQDIWEKGLWYFTESLKNRSVGSCLLKGKLWHSLPLVL